jgi:enterochelin esterase-like enzyme
MTRLTCTALLTAALLSLAGGPAMPRRAAGVRFEVDFFPIARKENLTGRCYVALSRDDKQPPIQTSGSTGTPLFAVDVHDLAPEKPVVIDGSTLGHPVRTLYDLPAGEYWVQAFFNVYTECKRADGAVVWVHLDQGEGQDWKRSPGNLYSKPRKLTIPDTIEFRARLHCDQVIPPIPPAKDTEFVKHIKFESKILTQWWGVPIHLGATVLLPKDYPGHPEVRYPVNYVQGHFSPGAPLGFGRGGAMDAFWFDEETPRFIAVTFQHPTPFYDDSYAVNSENNGPYGDAILQELIPEVERQYRVIAEPWARCLSGGSTGGWEALALQIFHPDFFGGCWASCPDPVDFRYHQIVNIYEDANAYYIDKGFTRVERPNTRKVDGNVESMMKDENGYELVCGDKSRSGGQWDIWEATYSPRGLDGYPMRLWDKRTGEIYKGVAAYWREHYDLRHILETRWKELGPKLAGKLHVYVGDADTYYLNNAVKLLDDFLKTTKDPHYGGTVEFGSCKPHCWGPNTRDTLKLMAEHVTKNAPAGADVKSWRYR